MKIKFSDLYMYIHKRSFFFFEKEKILYYFYDIFMHNNLFRHYPTYDKDI